jgi:hypothetical protein
MRYGGSVSVWWWMKNVKERVEKVDIHHFFRQARAAFPVAGRQALLFATRTQQNMEQTHSRHGFDVSLILLDWFYTCV